MNKWISVNDRLPEAKDGAGHLSRSTEDFGVFVIAYWKTPLGDCYGEAYYSEGQWFSVYGDDEKKDEYVTPTHWRRWPKPPQ